MEQNLWIRVRNALARRWWIYQVTTLAIVVTLGVVVRVPRWVMWAYIAGMLLVTMPIRAEAIRARQRDRQEESHSGPLR